MNSAVMTALKALLHNNNNSTASPLLVKLGFPNHVWIVGAAQTAED